MVPRVFPAFPTRDDVSVYATLRPAREVGGDFYDFYFVDDANLFFCVGDVSDKGVPAALFMAVTKTLIRARSAEELSTANIAGYLNAELGRDNEKCMFVTLFLGRLDVGTGELVFTNAGHDPPYVRRADGSLERLVERHGPLVGVAPGVAYRESRRQLGPGDLLVVYTDGVTEARDAGGQLFSEERMAEIVRTEGALPPDAVVDRILASVDSFETGAERADDVTVLALRFQPAAESRTVLAETVVLSNQSSELDLLDDRLDRFGKRGRLPAATMAELRIVCDEIVSNVIAHAHPQSGQHDIELRLELDGAPARGDRVRRWEIVRSAGGSAAGHDPAPRAAGGRRPRYPSGEEPHRRGNLPQTGRLQCDNACEDGARPVSGPSRRDHGSPAASMMRPMTEATPRGRQRLGDPDAARGR